jgi:hypothetical protein
MVEENILLTSCAGPASANVIKCFKAIPKRPKIIGIDMDKYLINLSEADTVYVCSSAARKDDKTLINELYRSELKFLGERYNIKMLYPQSDIEVYLCSKYRNELPPMVLPAHSIIELCQDKGALYDFLSKERLRVPPYKNPTKRDVEMLSLESPNYGVWSPNDWQYPCWVRARKGAGGNKGFICRDWRDFRNMAEFYRGREEVEWQMVKLLTGRDYSWTSLWYKGNLITSVLKQRLSWVYNRIGTTAVQRTVHDNAVNVYCDLIVSRMASRFDDELTGIMMVDLKEDGDSGSFYVTEINAGRLGTVNYNYELWSKEIYNDHRMNFPWLLWNICRNGELPDYKYAIYDAFPKGLYYARHIDMNHQIWRRLNDM